MSRLVTDNIRKWTVGGDGAPLGAHIQQKKKKKLEREIQNSAGPLHGVVKLKVELQQRL